jgi:hypothetical protein
VHFTLLVVKLQQSEATLHLLPISAQPPFGSPQTYFCVWGSLLQLPPQQSTPDVHDWPFVLQGSSA